VPLRIAFDLDGVLADMDGELLRQARILFGEAVAVQHQSAQVAPDDASPAPADQPTTDPSDMDAASPITTLQLTERQLSRLWRHIAMIENFWESLSELEPGAIARLSTLATDRRWEVIFLTKRPETAGATSQVQTQRWLASKGFALPSVFVVQRSRGRVAAALGLDFVIDDRPENCLDVVTDSRARAILVWRDDERLLPAAACRLGIGSVKKVGECLDILTEVDAHSAQRPGVVDRVMRLLGLTTAPARVQPSLSSSADPLASKPSTDAELSDS
jgi:hypothetical protein